MLDFLKSNIQKVKDDIADTCQKFSVDSSSITLCAVSKTKPLEYITKACELGISTFGENYVQEIEEKIGTSKRNYNLHLIGHLQSNKASKVIPLVDSIDSVDSLKLLNKINSFCQSNARDLDIMLEYNCSKDENKTGFLDIDEMKKALDFIQNCPHLHFKGLMTMGPLGAGDTEIRRAFDDFLRVFDTLEGEYKNLDFLTKSFGMSSDYKIAIEMGSNFLRIGTAIFGERL